jgi:hypothetical protein
MSRKRPSRHSEDQFALFLERIRDTLGNEDNAKFDKAVSSLIRRHKRGDNGQDRGMSNGASLAEQDRRRPATRSSSGKLDALTVRLGQLVIDWSDNEGLLLDVLTLLLETDEKSAAIVQSVLSTTDARLELVRRLAALKVADPALRQSLDTVLEGVRDADLTREEFLRSGFTNGLADEVGADRLHEVREKLRLLNRGLSELLPRLRAELGGQ